ncbi:MAG: YfhO family protein [Chitinivibrionales bacterium]|nr:YfhO family protein [Chitinivibrionales bacterium]
MGKKKRKKTAHKKPDTIAPAPAKKRDLRKYARYTPLALVVLWVVFYSPLLFGNFFLWEDVLYQHYPNLRFTMYCLKNFCFPHWTPFVFCGMPFSADILTTIFYPPHWLLFLASMFSNTGGISYTWYILGHILILGVGTYLMLLSFSYNRASALLGAIGFMFTGYVSLHVIHTTLLYVLAWFPFAFKYLKESYETGALKKLVLACVFFGVSTLGGYPQPTLHIIYFFLFYTAFFTFIRFRANGKIIVYPTVYYALFVALSLALSASQYLPSTELMSQSLRETMTYENSIIGSIPPARLLTFFAPKFFGYVSGHPDHVLPYWGFPQRHFFWETNAFVGIVVLFLALRAIVDFKRNALVAFFAILSILLLLLSLGEYTPLYSIVFHLLPGFNKFRIPGRMTLWLSFCLIMLAVYGMNALKKASENEERAFLRVLIALSGMISFLGLLFISGVFDNATEMFQNKAILQNSKNAAVSSVLATIISAGYLIYLLRSKRTVWKFSLLCLLLFIELAAFGRDFGISRMNPERFYGRMDYSPLKEELKSGFFRVQSRIYHGPRKGEMLFPRNLGNVEQIPLTEGYNQLMLQRYNDFLYGVNEDVFEKLLAIRYKKIPGKSQFGVIQHLPRVYVTPYYKVCKTKEEAFNYLNSPQFVPGTHLALNEEPAIKPDLEYGDRAEIELIKETPNKIEFNVHAHGNTLLTISEIFYPAWKAYVDGQRTDVLAGNYLFRTIPISKGEHKVIFKFQSTAALSGILISLAACLALLVLFLVESKYKLNVPLYIPEIEVKK